MHWTYAFRINRHKMECTVTLTFNVVKRPFMDFQSPLVLINWFASHSIQFKLETSIFHLHLLAFINKYAELRGGGNVGM